jgi:hypothetical protein
MADDSGYACAAGRAYEDMHDSNLRRGQVTQLVPGNEAERARHQFFRAARCADPMLREA